MSLPVMNTKRNKRILAAARRAGWPIRVSKKGVVIYPPDGSRPVALHSSNRGGYRQASNAEVQLRKAGLHW